MTKSPTSAEEIIRRYKQGERDFREANLRGATLSNADLREAESLLGCGDWSRYATGPDDHLFTLPSIPSEYIEFMKETLHYDFVDLNFISAEQFQLANMPVARLVYSYDGQNGRVTEESTTLFGDSVTFQLVSEVPTSHYPQYQPRLQQIMQSFRIVSEIPTEIASSELATISPAVLDYDNRQRKEYDMYICDICNGTIEGSRHKKYSNNKFKKIINKGFNPFDGNIKYPLTGLPLPDMGAAMGLSNEVQYSRWKNDAMVDSTDWILCQQCFPYADNYK